MSEVNCGIGMVIITKNNLQLLGLFFLFVFFCFVFEFIQSARQLQKERIQMPEMVVQE